MLRLNASNAAGRGKRSRSGGSTSLQAGLMYDMDLGLASSAYSRLVMNKWLWAGAVTVQVGCGVPAVWQLL
jgi:hypothetical protein